MSMMEWAKREVELACKIAKKSSENSDEWNYIGACYESALRAFESLLGDDHSGMSIHLTKVILNRLIDGKPLTPIEDTEDIWEGVAPVCDEKELYQCKRMSSLFKSVDSKGNVTYDDVNRILCVDINNHSSWTNGFVCKIINEMFPITMPYVPSSKPIKVYMEEILTDPKNGDFDTMAIIDVATEDGEIIPVNRYFKESENSFVEIDAVEWSERIDLHNQRLVGMNNK